jgi:hypothetical protein
MRSAPAWASPSTGAKRPWKAESGEAQPAWRSRALGVKATMGLRSSAFAWPRSRWNHCAGVEAFTTCRLARAQRARIRSTWPVEWSGPPPSQP